MWLFLVTPCDIGNRTVFNTAAAASTQIRVDTAGSFVNPDLKISRRTLDRFNVCVREYLDVEMPADLDQFGRDNSHSTVISGKCLVELRHYTTYGW
jgi:hypothetical protein